MLRCEAVKVESKWRKSAIAIQFRRQVLQHRAPHLARGSEVAANEPAKLQLDVTRARRP